MRYLRLLILINIIKYQREKKLNFQTFQTIFFTFSATFQKRRETSTPPIDAMNNNSQRISEVIVQPDLNPYTISRTIDLCNVINKLKKSISLTSRIWSLIKFISIKMQREKCQTSRKKYDLQPKQSHNEKCYAILTRQASIMGRLIARYYS